MKKVLFAALALFMCAQFVLAVDFSQGVSDSDQALFDQILVPVLAIYNLIKYIASAVAGIALLFSGVTYMVSGNDPRKRDNAKSMAMYVVIGLVIIWAAPLVVQLIVG